MHELGILYPKAGFWIFCHGSFCISGEVAWYQVDKDKNTVLGNGFSGAFDCPAVLLDGERAEFDVAGGRLILYF